MKKWVALFLSLSLSFQVQAASPKKYQLADGSFSSLILTNQEFDNLTTDQQAIYIGTMIQVLGAMEKMQSKVIGKDGGNENKTSSVPLQKSNFWAHIFSQEAFAIVGEAIEGFAKLTSKGYAEFVGLWSRSAREVIVVGRDADVALNQAKSASRVAEEGRETLARSQSAVAQAKRDSVAAKASGNSSDIAAASSNVREALVEDTAAATRFREATGAQLKAVEAAKLAVLRSDFVKAIKKVTDVEQKLAKAEKGSAKYIALEKDLKTATTELRGPANRYREIGGSSKEEGAILREEFAKQGVLRVPSAQTLALVLGSGTIGLATGLKLNDIDTVPAKTFVMPPPASKSLVGAPAMAKQKLSSSLGTPDEVTGSNFAKKGSTVAASGQACLFGLWPAQWQQQGSTIKCHRPEASKTQACNEKFQCPNFGFGLTNLDINSKLCEPMEPLESLSERCGTAFSKVVKALPDQIGFNPKNFKDKYKHEFANIVTSIEADASMLNTQGSPISMKQYCEGAQDVQGRECGGLLSILNSADGTVVRDTIAARKVATAPAAGAPDTTAH